MPNFTSINPFGSEIDITELSPDILVWKKIETLSLAVGDGAGQTLTTANLNAYSNVKLIIKAPMGASTGYITLAGTGFTASQYLCCKRTSGSIVTATGASSWEILKRGTATTNPLFAEITLTKHSTGISFISEFSSYLYGGAVAGQHPDNAWTTFAIYQQTASDLTVEVYAR